MLDTDMINAIVESVKKTQGITHTEFDTQITSWVNAGVIDLGRLGVISSNQQTINSIDDLVRTAITTYVLQFLDVKNAKLYEDSYKYQADTLRHITEYIQ